MVTRTSTIFEKQTIALALFAGGLAIWFTTAAFSVESLQGPEFGEALWVTHSEQTPNDTVTHTQRFANIDAPIPAPIPGAMPFATFRYHDNIGPGRRRFLADQRIGLGFLHHAAEGDPAWRVDVSRSGLWSVRGDLWARFIVNLVKPYPWFKLRASDAVSSWVGIHGIANGKKNIRWIPEFAWIRQDNNGLILDLLAPQHVFFGFRGPILGLLIGPEQTLHRWTARAHGENYDEWAVQQQFRAKVSVAVSPSFVFYTSALREISQSAKNPALGAEVSLQWIPNP